MPRKGKKDQDFVRSFLLAYENYSWADADIDWLEKRLEGAVEATPPGGATPVRLRLSLSLRRSELR